MKNQPVCFDFKTYRDYLKSYYEWRKAVDPRFSYRSFSEAAGLGSPNYLQLVISGKRNLTIENIHQFALALGLGLVELQYFEQMVLRDQSKDPKQEHYYGTMLKKLKREKRERTMRAETPELLVHWYFPGVIAVVSGRKEPVALDEIARMTGLGAARVRNVLEELLAKGLVRVQDGGYLLEEEKFVYHYRSKIKDRFKFFQEGQLKRTQEALEKQLEQGAKFFSHAFTIAKRDRETVVERIKFFLSELADETNLNEAEELMQLNIQLFPFVIDHGRRG